MRSDSSPSDEDVSAGVGRLVDDAASVVGDDDIVLAEEEEEACGEPNTPEGSVSDQQDVDEGQTYSHADVGVQTMAVHITDNIVRNGRSGSRRNLFTSVCGTATRLTKGRVIVAITIMVVVVLIALIEKMSGLEFVDENRIIHDLAPHILPIQQQQQTSASEPPTTSESHH
jgi:hypothetical protein